MSNACDLLRCMQGCSLGLTSRSRLGLVSDNVLWTSLVVCDRYCDRDSRVSGVNITSAANRLLLVIEAIKHRTNVG